MKMQVRIQKTMENFRLTQTESHRTAMGKI